MKQKNLPALLACFLLSPLFVFSQTATPRITIDVSAPGATIPASLYGVFFEEINHSGDGGLYGELIQNRGFEDKNLPGGTRLDSGFAIAPAKPNYRSNQLRNFRVPWNMDNLWPGWSLEKQGAAQAELRLTTDHPLNTATPHALQLTIALARVNEPVELSNEGFWGIALKQGERYNLRFYLRSDNNYKGDVTAKLVGADGKIWAQKIFAMKKAGAWNEYTAQLTATGTDAKAHFTLSFDAPGNLWVDYVSLFPEKTFKNRRNGMRADVAQLLADLKPAFMRWPGGCIVEGLTLENRVKWKETLGDPVNRPGEYDVWGYRNSYGFGYHEFLQFVEDIGAKGMFVTNIGVSCSVRNGDYCTVEEVGNYVQDALDAIEYAIGDVRTTWGAKRAAAGHPAPFPLQYVEVGNEDAGVEMYNQRYNLFYKAIHTKYPQITIISNHGLNDNLATVEKLEMIDPHYYVTPDWFYTRSNTLFDTIRERTKYSTYVGEYAANRNVGSGNMNGALSEAAFLIGAERNSDFVTMTSYAPLIENSNKRDWPVNMIWVKADQAMGRSSYYVQKLFAENRPDINLKTILQEPVENLPKEPFRGIMGLATNRAQVSFADLGFTTEGAASSMDMKNWQAVDGQWLFINNEYVQTDTAGRHLSFLKNQPVGNGTIEFKVKKKGRVNANPNNQGGGRFGGGPGYALLFGGTDEKNFYQLTFGNRFISLDKMVNGVSQFVMDPVRFNLDDDHDYKAKLSVNNDKVELFIDGQSVLKYTYAPLIKHYAIAGIDRKKNEIVIKVVNAESTPFTTGIDLKGAGKIGPSGNLITLFSATETEENSFDQPMKIAPENETYSGFGNSFSMTFRPYSLTVLRIRQ